MSSKFVQCEFCKTEVSLDSCEFAKYHTIIDGKEHVFCCVKCAQKDEKKTKE